eukprot:8934944-Karenia_brevis.AAC.1
MARANREARRRLRIPRHSDACSARVPDGPGAVRAENRTPRNGWSSKAVAAAPSSSGTGCVSAVSGVRVCGSSPPAHLTSSSAERSAHFVERVPIAFR